MAKASRCTVTSSPALRILLVDDDADLRRLLAAILGRDGFDVEEACDGEEALALFAHADHDDAASVADVIVTDIWMPRCCGLTMLARLRERGVTTPVVVLSAHVDGETKARAQSLHASALLAKPFDAGDLRRTVRRIAQVRAPVDAAARMRARAPLAG
jgi:two-component system response regulator AtoC